MKKVEVTSCNHSQGRPISRVTMSKMTVVQKPSSRRPHSIISTVSSGSSARHLRWWRDHVAAMTPKPPRIRRRSTVHRGPAYACTALVPFEADERAHRHVELAQLGGAAEVGQIDDEAGGEHLRAQLAQELDRALRRAAGGDQVVDQDDPVDDLIATGGTAEGAVKL